METTVLPPDQPAGTTIAQMVQEHEYLRRMEHLANDLRNVILPLGIALSVEKNLDRLLERIVVEAKALCNADAGTLYLRTRDDRLKFEIMRTDSLGIALGGTTGKEIPFAPVRMYDEAGTPNEHNVVSCVALHGGTVNVPDIYAAAEFDFSGTKIFDQRNQYRSKSTLTVPMKNNEDRVVAVLQLLNAREAATGEVIAFDEYQALVVESLASQASVALNNQLLLERQKELLKYERDLQIGRQIQAGFLPDVLPQPKDWQIAARFQPAREVAGDFYDAFTLARGRVGVVVADVCDKGVGAALFMALVRSLIRAYLQLQSSSASAADETGSAGMTALRDAIVQTNNYIGENHADMNMFATTFAAVLDPASGSVVYVNGGHNPPAIVGRDGIRQRLMPTGPAVGMIPGFAYKVGEAALAPGEFLVAFTDGATDARSPQGEFFSEARLLQAITDIRTAPSAAAAVAHLHELLIAHISTANQYDDITLLVVRRTPEA